MPTGNGFWCDSWPENPAWKFAATGIGHDVAHRAEFLRALAEVDPDRALNIEHEDAVHSRTEGLAPAAKTCTPPRRSCRAAPRTATPFPDSPDGSGGFTDDEAAGNAVQAGRRLGADGVQQ